MSNQPEFLSLDPGPEFVEVTELADRERRWMPIPSSPFSPTLRLDPDPAVMAERVGLAEGDVFTMDGVRYHVDAVEPAEGVPDGDVVYRVSAL